MSATAVSPVAGLLRFVPGNASHCAVEERMHRGSAVYAVVAIVPDGAVVALNGYSDKDLAYSTCELLNSALAAS
jgi:hypothetical protein